MSCLINLSRPSHRLSQTDANLLQRSKRRKHLFQFSCSSQSYGVIPSSNAFSLKKNVGHGPSTSHFCQSCLDVSTVTALVEFDDMKDGSLGLEGPFRHGSERAVSFRKHYHFVSF